MKGPEWASPQREKVGEWGLGWGETMECGAMGTQFLFEGSKMS